MSKTGLLNEKNLKITLILLILVINIHVFTIFTIMSGSHFNLIVHYRLPRSVKTMLYAVIWNFNNMMFLQCYEMYMYML